MQMVQVEWAGDRFKRTHSCGEVTLPVHASVSRFLQGHIESVPKQKANWLTSSSLISLLVRCIVHERTKSRWVSWVADGAGSCLR
jgi:hypothetical protein